MGFFHFKFLQANVRGEKGGNFVVGPGRHLASLRHCSVGKIIRLNCPGKKHISDVGMLLIVITKIIENISWHFSCYFF